MAAAAAWAIVSARIQVMGGWTTMLQPEWLPHYTAEEYRRWEGDWELIDGIPFAMTPSATFLHQRVGARIVMQLEQQLESCRDCTLVYETDWVVADDTVVRPDIAVFCAPVTEAYPRIPPRLVVEILSEATRHKDETVKRALYAANGVRHYLLVDPDTRQLRWLTLRGGALEPTTDSEAGPITLDLGPCTVRLHPAHIWPASDRLP